MESNGFVLHRPDTSPAWIWIREGLYGPQDVERVDIPDQVRRVRLKGRVLAIAEIPDVVHPSEAHDQRGPLARRADLLDVQRLTGSHNDSGSTGKEIDHVHSSCLPGYRPA